MKQHILLSATRLRRGMSTIINVISSDKIIANFDLSGHAYDVLSFDFNAAFDKTSHRFVME